MLGFGWGYSASEALLSSLKLRSAPRASPSKSLPKGDIGVSAPSNETASFLPIATRLARPYSLPFFRFPFSGPLLAVGQSSIQADAEFANSFRILKNSRRTVLQEEIESDIVTFQYQSRLRNGWQWGVQVPVGSTGPGFMDPIIAWYHRAFLHITDARDHEVFSPHLVAGPNEPDVTGGYGLGDISGTLAYPLTPRSRITFGLKLPTGNPNSLLGSGGVDLGVEIEHFIPIKPRWGFSIQLGEIRQCGTTFLKNARPWVYQVSGALTWTPNKKDGWTVQLQRESSALNTGVSISDQIQTTTSVGYVRHISDTRSLTFYFSEDLDLLNPNIPDGVGIGPDFTFGISYAVRI